MITKKPSERRAREEIREKTFSCFESFTTSLSSPATTLGFGLIPQYPLLILLAQLPEPIRAVVVPSSEQHRQLLATPRVVILCLLFNCGFRRIIILATAVSVTLAATARVGVGVGVVSSLSILPTLAAAAPPSPPAVVGWLRRALLHRRGRASAHRRAHLGRRR